MGGIKTTHKLDWLDLVCLAASVLTFEVQGDCLAAVTHTEFFKQVPDVVLNRVGRDCFFGRDFLIGAASCQARKDFKLKMLLKLTKNWGLQAPIFIPAVFYISI